MSCVRWPKPRVLLGYYQQRLGTKKGDFFSLSQRGYFYASCLLLLAPSVSVGANGDQAELSTKRITISTVNQLLLIGIGSNLEREFQKGKYQSSRNRQIHCKKIEGAH